MCGIDTHLTAVNLHSDIARDGTCVIGTAIDAPLHKSTSHNDVDCRNCIAVAISATTHFAFHRTAENVYLRYLFNITRIASTVNITTSIA